MARLPKIRIGQVLERIKGTKPEKIRILEKKDFSLFQSMSLLADGLDAPPLATQHPLRLFSQSLKNQLSKYQTANYLEVLDLAINFTLDESRGRHGIYSDSRLLSEILEDDIISKYQYALRIDNLISYFRSLKRSLEAGQISTNKIQLSTILNMVDSTLLGTGAERVLAHLHLYRPRMTQSQLQHSFYLLYNSEIETIQSAFSSFPGIQKYQMKHFPQAARVYLLDTLELNTKSRCVFAWADKNYSSFQDLTDDQEIGVNDILASRVTYFHEGNSIGKHFIESYIAQRRVKVNDKEETRQNIRLGGIFFLLTCLVDWYLCTI